MDPATVDTPDLRAASDEGRLDNDDVTNLTSLTFDSDNAEAGTLLELIDNDNQSTVYGTIPSAAAGAYDISGDLAAAANAGAVNVAIRSTDAAGNTSLSAPSQ